MKTFHTKGIVKKKNSKTISRGNALNFKIFFGPLGKTPKGSELLKSKSLCSIKPRDKKLLNVLSHIKPNKIKLNYVI